MSDEFLNNENWSKRYLPHYNAVDKLQIITFRLADSLPQSVLNRVDTTIENSTSSGAPHSDAGKGDQRKKLIDSYLDKGYGSCLLSYPDVAAKAIEALEFFNEDRYKLISYVIMPNHIHVLIKVIKDIGLGKIVWSWKRHVSKYVFENESYKKEFLIHLENGKKEKLFSRAPLKHRRFHRPASECGAPLKHRRFQRPASECGAPQKVSLWQREYWDRFVRDEEHFSKAVEYIMQNPVKAGLVKDCKDWLWLFCLSDTKE